MARAAYAMARATFQTLIGTIKTYVEQALMAGADPFQTLIGTIKTPSITPPIWPIGPFQTLIGTIKTGGEYPASPPGRRGFKPS